MIERLQALPGVLATNARAAIGVFLVDAEFRLYWAWVLCFLVLSLVSWWIYYRRDGERGWRGFLRFVFPRDVYLHPSARVDYRLYLSNAVLFPATETLATGLAASVGISTALWLERRFGSSGDMFAWHATSMAAFTIVAALAADFATYVVHAVHHRVPLLWEFHKVHHSAEVLTPITVYRKHPLYDVFANVVRGTFAGLLQGAAAYAFIGRPTMISLFGINAVYALFHIGGSNLRHSHVWLSFGYAASHIFISPAQHQIHHSTAQRHWNRNYGEMFAVWDWIFGTLYVPHGREQLEFGIRDAVEQEHPTLWKAYVVPFINGYRLLRRGRRRAVQPET